MAKLKKGSKAAKAWGAKMKRARNKPTRSRAKRKITVKSRKRRGTVQMARRKTNYKRRAKSATSSIMSGVFKPKGMIAAVILGLGAAALANYVPIQIPYKEELAAGLVGGVPAAGAVFALKQLPTINLGSISSNGYVAGY